MVAFNDVQAQLVNLRSKDGFLGVHEVRKIAFLLDPDEKILLCKKGWVNKKSTILCVTDKKIAYIDVRSRNYVVGKIDFSEITTVLHTVGKVSKTVRIYTQDAALYFVVWRQRDAKELHSIVDRHLRYLTDYVNSTRTVRGTITPVRDLQSWRSLVKRVGATSVAR